MFARLRERGRIPRICATNTSAEYWRGDASLIHTDIEGRRDVEPADFVRTYLFAGTQHTPGALPPLAADPNTGSRGHHRFNVVDYAPLLRAALVNVDRWVTDDTEPPPSAFPRLADKTAVEAETLATFYGKVPGMRFPERVRETGTGSISDPGWRKEYALYPPQMGAPYRTYRIGGG